MCGTLLERQPKDKKGSDHRAVRVKMHVKSKLQSSRKRKRKVVKRGWKPSDEYHVELDKKLASVRISSLTDLGEAMLDAAQMSTPQSSPQDFCKPLQSAEMKRLVNERRSCSNQITRRQLSKDIFKVVRQLTRQYQTDQTKKILASFKNLGRLDRSHRCPRSKSSQNECQPEDFAELLSQIYSSDDPVELPCSASLSCLQHFSLQELTTALKTMSLNKCVDEEGICLEMLKYGTPATLNIYLKLVNDLIIRGRMEDSWRKSLFMMIPKTGDLTQATNYRPIAILSIFYKAFSRMVYNRILPILDAQQSHDQYGFRPGIRLDDALAVVETLISKCNEFNLPIWLASLDLKKAFDKITHKVIFEALRNQGIEEAMVALIIDLYSNQTGCVDSNSEFLISRGVRQGDVLSSIIFNAALELIFQRWKAQLNHHGWMLSGPNDERLTNARYVGTGAGRRSYPWMCLFYLVSRRKKRFNQDGELSLNG